MLNGIGSVYMRTNMQTLLPLVSPLSLLPPPPQPSIQLCIQLWLSLFNTHNYQTIIMIIGFTSMIVCRLPFYACMCRNVRRFVICLPHTKIYLPSFCYIDAMNGWMECECVCVPAILRAHGYSAAFFLRVCVCVFVGCAYCVVAQSLTFSTINCILICMGLDIHNKMAWAGIFCHSIIILLLFCECDGWMEQKPWNEAFHQLLNENQKLFLKCVLCTLCLYLCLYKCMHVYEHALLFLLSPQQNHTRFIWRPCPLVFTRKKTMKINVIWFIIYDSMDIKTQDPYPVRYTHTHTQFSVTICHRRHRTHKTFSFALSLHTGLRVSGCCRRRQWSMSSVKMQFIFIPRWRTRTRLLLLSLALSFVHCLVLSCLNLTPTTPKCANNTLIAHAMLHD